MKKKSIHMLNKKKYRIILCGGGTGGHIFPMLSIADEIKKQNIDSKVLFIGSKDRMEMDIIPKYNYKVIGLWISGIKRVPYINNIIGMGLPFLFKNISLPIKIMHSIIKSIFILLKFKPDAVIGFGGYSSGPILLSSNFLGYKTFIQEQNSFPGYTNRILSNKVNFIFVAFDNMNRYIKGKNILNLGNPVRKIISNLPSSKKKASKYFNLDNSKKTVLVIGGSLGAKTINESILTNLSLIKESSFQLIWQTGNGYYNKIESDNLETSNIKILPFIERMDLAYSMADIIISRAGAISISELCIVGKPLILIPSPNVADDHQTKNATNILNNKGCILVKDKDAKNQLMKEVVDLLNNDKKINEIKKNLKKLSKPNATFNIVNELFKLL
jgi:UDP-N-acetylglucosamine--N-acetylmuramyl-(pentapeptide) pyrophosphoryl-undecaprenol N-acetylglucosamine transferase